jgi:hypothetical protein
MTSVRIAQRFCGPASSANGGYASGLFASVLDGPAEVTLRAPPPLGVELSLTRADDASATLRQLDGTLIAEARQTVLSLDVPSAVSFEEAVHASRRFIGFQRHPYPSCFVCGHQRPSALGAGLCLYPGAVAQSAGSTPRVAAPFQPESDLCDATGTLRDEFVWAALDCPSWFGHASFATEVPKILLGRLSVEIARRPHAQERCVVQGWSLGREGRRFQCASALYGADGACVARASAVWIALKDG